MGTHTNCSFTEGWKRVGTNITWTATSGTNYKYGFVSNTTWSDSYATTTSAVVEDTTTYAKSASYLYYNVTITKNTGTASATHSSGYLLNGTTGNFTATANTSNTKYSYSTSSADTHTQSYTVSSAGQEISSGTVYTWYYATIQSGTGCSADLSTGWFRSGTTITWATSSTYYSFAAGSTQDTTETASVTSAGTYSKTPTNYKAAAFNNSSYATATKTSYSSAAPNTSTYYPSGTTIT